MRFMILVKANKDSIEWVRRFPDPAGDGREGEIDVRQLFELDDFEQGPAIDRFREMGLPSQR